MGTGLTPQDCLKGLISSCAVCSQNSVLVLLLMGFWHSHFCSLLPTEPSHWPGLTLVTNGAFAWLHALYRICADGRLEGPGLAKGSGGGFVCLFLVLFFFFRISLLPSMHVWGGWWCECQRVRAMAFSWRSEATFGSQFSPSTSVPPWPAAPSQQPEDL